MISRVQSSLLNQTPVDLLVRVVSCTRDLPNLGPRLVTPAPTGGGALDFLAFESSLVWVAVAGKIRNVRQVEW